MRLIWGKELSIIFDQNTLYVCVYVCVKHSTIKYSAKKKHKIYIPWISILYY